MHGVVALLALSVWGGGRDFYPREYCATAGIDLNRDGVDDLVVGLNGYEVSPDKVVVRDAGRVFVLSGKDGKVLLELHGDHFGDLFGAAVAPAGDANGDGVPDLWIGMPGAGEYSTDAKVPKVERVGGGGVRLCSGKDGSTLRELQWKQPCIDAGGGVWTIEDLDGDGVRDLCVASQQHQHLFAASSVTGKVMWTRQTDLRVRGDHVAVVDDVDADGVSDLAVGSFRTDDTDGWYRGRITTVSGRSGGEISVFRGPDVLLGQWAFMGEVAAVQDAKGVRSVLARCRLYTKGKDTITAVYLIAIPDHSWKGPLSTNDVEGRSTSGSDPSDSIGTSMACLGDIDGDGSADFAISAPRWACRERRWCGIVHVYSGKSLSVRSVIWPREPPGECECFGDQVGSIGDVNGDGVRDVFVVSWPCEDCSGKSAQRLDVYSGKTSELLWTTGLSTIGRVLKSK